MAWPQGYSSVASCLYKNMMALCALCFNAMCLLSSWFEILRFFRVCETNGRRHRASKTTIKKEIFVFAFLLASFHPTLTNSLSHSLALSHSLTHTGHGHVHYSSFNTICYNFFKIRQNFVCLSICVWVFERTCVYAYVSACVCVRAYVSACVCGCMSVRVFSIEWGTLSTVCSLF